MNELILSQNPAVKRMRDTMNELQNLCKQVTENYRPMLNGERYLTDDETSQVLKISRRTLQEYVAHPPDQVSPPCGARP